MDKFLEVVGMLNKVQPLFFCVKICLLGGNVRSFYNITSFLLLLVYDIANKYAQASFFYYVQEINFTLMNVIVTNIPKYY
jgi:hypothetical protein